MSKVKSIKYIGKKPVYNMYVDKHHNFLIQGNVVSHNCDALRYYCVYWLQNAESLLNSKKVKWREDQWEDYENASDSDKLLLIKKWGEPA